MPDAPWLADIDFVAFEDLRELSRLKSKIDIRPRELTDDEVRNLVAFLNSLTGTESVKGRLGKPDRVPSGLRVD